MAQRIKIDDLDVVVMPQSRFLNVLEVGNAAQVVKVGDVRVLVVYPDGASAEEIERLIDAAEAKTA